MLGRVTTPQNLDERFRDAVSALRPEGSRRPDGAEAVRDGSALTGARARELFDAQSTSRHLDLAARWLRGFHEGFSTLGSSGHEGNAAVAAALRPDDPALLHHRSGAFYCVRAASCPDSPDPDPLAEAARDVLRGVVASAAEPLAGGRHQVLGRADLRIIPVASTAAAHLPRAVGIAYAISAVPELRGVESPWPADAIAVASFDGAAVDHVGATAALNTIGWYAHTGRHLPLLLVCEDTSPTGWVADTLRARPGLRYLAADGCEPATAYDTARAAVDWVREQRRPAVLHLRTVRLLGSAAANPGATADVDRDPLVATARLLVGGGFATGEELLTRYDELGWQVRKIAEDVLGEPRLAGTAEIVAPLAPRRPLRAARHVADAATRAGGAGSTARARAFDGRLPEQSGPLTLAQTITATLTDALLTIPGAILYGEQVAVHGGVHGITRDLHERFGDERVFDTLLDETSILGLGLGAALSLPAAENRDKGFKGILPIPEIPYLARLHSAEDQLRGEAATMSFFSQGAFRNPMVVRVAGLAGPEGFGGHFRNDNSVAVLRDVPGLVLAVPARAADAAPMLRSCLAAAAVDGTVSVFLEPLALYHSRDLFQQGDGELLAPYAPPAQWPAAHIPIGRARTYPFGSAEDLTILTYGNGVRMSLRVAARLAAGGYGSRVVDLRWLNPLPAADLLREASATGRVLIADETRRSGGVGEGILAALVDGGFVGAARRIAAADSLVPPGPAAHHVLIGEDAITQGAHALLAR
ncbi:transketolase C-terminal domain-containing protein [Couchioplanes caeruleus]|uniref:3-methyl-2-oxobutanoate dehydrogenase (2-methylpropanoyl-transferring) n=2 Tax=Couchioplanes caeruleus TaxID=56438 RepID=A0A1K0GTZ0_9ACTN|nr:transketolase C-terminal domain-containing protein [Couchioplanes caeruleus]OJF12787.1 MFS transporter [Couchioplanes caeruleus subsp. caeruleus]ROP29433.1 2-oxoisovalerate dehydrogenase E1 component [Couchioplanes caeruleus]